jgi:hypothetical protein
VWLMDFANGETLTLRSTVTTYDDLGNATTVVTESSWGPCAVAPRYATESTDSRVAPVVVGLVIYGPTVAINSDDTIVRDGIEWQVDGLPGEWRNPFTGWEPGMEVPVKRAAAV